MQSGRQRDASAEPDQNREEIDLSLLEDSLRLTPWQRLLENERALELVRMLEAAQPPAMERLSQILERLNHADSSARAGNN